MADSKDLEATDAATAHTAATGVDLSKVEGTGAGGRNTKADVEAFTPAEPVRVGVAPDSRVPRPPTEEEIAAAQADVDAARRRQDAAAVDVRAAGTRPAPLIAHKLRPGDPCPECGVAIADAVSPALNEEQAKVATEPGDARNALAVEFHYAAFHPAAQTPQFRPADS
jgi:pyruvate/2-oxoglutarate dehydrogenase complex dihydrolipoamide acyltransferase (E2) component